MHPLMPTDSAPPGVRIDEGVVRLLEASFLALAPKADELSTVFYDRLFAQHPGVRGMFPTDMTAQKVKLMDSIAMVIKGLRDPASFRGKLNELGQKHADVGTKAEHYPAVWDAMLWSMAKVAGPAWTPTLETEWRRALQLISAMMLAGVKGHGR